VIEKDKHPLDTSLAVRLDAERRREIDDVRKRFETFYIEETKFQAEMKNSMSIVSEQQKGLKERFEEGVSRRLTGLDNKFDKFLVEWGRKQEQDKMRDERTSENKKEIKETKSSLNWLTRSLIISVCGGVLVSIILYAFQYFKG